MLLTPHTLVGLTIAASIKDPVISVPLSFIMHFLGDAVPHWDFFSGTPEEERLKGWRIPAVMLDLVIGVAIGMTFTLYYLWVRKDPAQAVNMFLCGIFSCLPDVLEAPRVYFNSNDPFSRFIHYIQHNMQFQAGVPWGIISQIGVILVCSALLLNSL